ncbi:unnamed protein product, partial [Heterotrigona itama]
AIASESVLTISSYYGRLTNLMVYTKRTNARLPISCLYSYRCVHYNNVGVNKR